MSPFTQIKLLDKLLKKSWVAVLPILPVHMTLLTLSGLYYKKGTNSSWNSVGIVVFRLGMKKSPMTSTRYPKSSSQDI